MHGRQKLYFCECGTIKQMVGPAVLACPRCGAQEPLQHGVVWSTALSVAPRAPRVPPRAMAADPALPRRVVACPHCGVVGPCVVFTYEPVGPPHLACPRCDHVWDPAPRDPGFATRPGTPDTAAAAAAAFASPR